ncbi:MAG: hypothetical protein JO287_03430 [Pseudonocardiales bacterium]|nr:hypothetical protein [Pseudonocardiales bacterium]
MSPSRRMGVVASLVLGVALAGCGSATTAKPAAPKGANPVAWVGVFCGGLGDVIAADTQAAQKAPTPQAQKDQLLTLADTTQQAFTNTARKLTQLGPPAVTAGQRAQDTMIGFFTTGAAAVGDQRAKVAALDANDPNFGQKADQLTGPDLGAAAAQLQGLTSNGELAPAFSAAPECQRLGH